MTYEDLIKHYGTQERIASALGIEQPSVSLWRKRGIPMLRQMQIQLVTAGRLIADIAPKHRETRLSHEIKAFNTSNSVFQKVGCSETAKEKAPQCD